MTPFPPLLSQFFYSSPSSHSTPPFPPYCLNQLSAVHLFFLKHNLILVAQLISDQSTLTFLLKKYLTILTHQTQTSYINLPLKRSQYKNCLTKCYLSSLLWWTSNKPKLLFNDLIAPLVMMLPLNLPLFIMASLGFSTWTIYFLHLFIYYIYFNILVSFFFILFR